MTYLLYMEKIKNNFWDLDGTILFQKGFVCLLQVARSETSTSCSQSLRLRSILRQAEAVERGQGYIARNGGAELEFRPESFDSMIHPRWFLLGEWVSPSGTNKVVKNLEN